MMRRVFGKSGSDPEPGEPRLDDILGGIRAEMDRVEDHLRIWSESSNPLIGDISRYLFRKNGKRLRPGLLILSAKLSGASKNGDAALMGSLVEVIHTASLVHDDIIDNAATRRSGESVHVRWGLNIAVLLGDYLFIKSLGLSFDCGDIRIVRLLTDLAGRMIEGELLEHAHNRKADITESQYMDIIGLKTASLFSTAARIGAILGQAPQAVEERLQTIGWHIGLAYQIVDDLLDFTGDERRLGKPVLSDLAQGRITLPVIHASGGCGETGSWADEVRRPDAPVDAGGGILDAVRRKGSLDYALRKAKEHASRARELAGFFPPSPHREALIRLARFIVDRAR